MHVGGRGRKRWPLNRFVEVAASLLEAGYRPWIFRGPREPSVTEAFTSLVERGLVLVPPADIVCVGQAMRRCRIVIAPDTGPMHLSSAVGVGTLALFLDSDARHYRPLGRFDRWIDARRKDLTADHVLRVAMEMLQQEQMPQVS
jgi:ADP-heptose:LPS heptosyltransferase